MITLFTFGPAFGLPDSSPFVMKAETLLKMAGLEYRTDKSGFGGAPKGKLPYMNDAGELIADSTFIRWHIEKKYGIDFDRRLTLRSAAWPGPWRSCSRTISTGPWCSRAGSIRRISPGARDLLRRSALADPAHRAPGGAAQDPGYLSGQGFGRHTTAEIDRLAARGIESVASVLGDKPYLMGDEPCGADATVFAFVANLLCPVFESRACAARPNRTPTSWPSTGACCASTSRLSCGTDAQRQPAYATASSRGSNTAKCCQQAFGVREPRPVWRATRESSDCTQTSPSASSRDSASRQARR
jgi:glutathione S-transferase